MSLERPILLFVMLSACGSSPLLGGHDADAPEPLPAELVAACPESTHFERTGQHACTEIGCVNGLFVEVSPSNGWASGAYRFELGVDGRKVICQGSIPLKACAERSFSCDADGVSLGESGCALPPDQQGIVTIMFTGFPLSLSMRVLKDDAELANTELKPMYKAGQPNGPGCDPVCCSASEALEVPEAAAH